VALRGEFDKALKPATCDAIRQMNVGHERRAPGCNVVCVVELTNHPGVSGRFCFLIVSDCP